MWKPFGTTFRFVIVFALDVDGSSKLINQSVAVDGIASFSTTTDVGDASSAFIF